jgi:ABC-type glycerol-3-phosphate transport system permease component
MTIYIALFLLCGAVFGLITFSQRHLFSEGPKEVEESADVNGLISRVMWMLICAFLWPIMVLTGLNSWRILSKRKADESTHTHDS